MTDQLNNKSKLYNVLGIARWGVEEEDGIHFESCFRNGTRYMAYVGHGGDRVLWDKDTSPTLKEFEAIEASI